jgi:hypothetical protein
LGSSRYVRATGEYQPIRFPDETSHESSAGAKDPALVARLDLGINEPSSVPFLSYFLRTLEPDFSRF